ncbi:hypothetical protein YT1_0106 [Rhodococcus ruber]|nr:hypothetical protein YT1_0106 [Rhodococcus ruber]
MFDRRTQIARNILSEERFHRSQSAFDDRFGRRRQLHPISTIGTDVCG